MLAFSAGVVIVNWNGHADTIACLDSLAAADPSPARIVVVDNASADGSVATLEAWAERHARLSVSLLAAAANRGFSAANNFGIAYLAQDPALTHFLLLNNDATVDRSLFAEFARAIELAPQAAIVGPTIYEAERPEQIWYAGGHFLTLRSLAVHRREAVRRDALVVPTDFVTGCAMMISRTAWGALGPLPECYFMYTEDAEYSYRAKAAGLLVIYAPRAVAHHAVGATVRRHIPSARVEYWKCRNRALFVRRNLRGWERWGALAYLTMTKPARAALEALSGRGPVGWAVLRGTVEGLLAVEGDRKLDRTQTGEQSAERVVVAKRS